MVDQLQPIENYVVEWLEKKTPFDVDEETHGLLPNAYELDGLSDSISITGSATSFNRFRNERRRPTPSFVPRRQVVRKVASSDSEYLGLGKALKARFIELLDQFPLGISIDKFMHMFYKTRGYYPKYGNYGYTSLQDLVEENRDAFLMVKSPLGEKLLFSPDVVEPVNVEGMFMKYWGKIKELLKTSGHILELNEIPELLSKKGSHVDPSDWCYLNECGYYNYCIQNDLEATNIFLDTRAEDEGIPVLVEYNEEVVTTLPYQRRREKRLQKQWDEKKVMKLREPRDHKLKSLGFVKPDAKMESIADEIQVGGLYKCLGGSVRNPGRFHVNLGGYWQSLEDLMEEMQKTYNGLERFGERNCTIPWKDHLKPGYYVVVKHDVDGEWHRAKILSHIGDSYEVCLIDYGDLVETDSSKIRYMYEGFFKALKSQSVLCVARMGSFYNRVIWGNNKMEFNKGRGWTDEEGDIFRGLIFDKTLAVQFKQKTEIEGESAWEVVIHIMKTGTNTVEYHHVEREVMRQSRGLYDISPDEETEKELTLKFKIFDGRKYN